MPPAQEARQQQLHQLFGEARRDVAARRVGREHAQRSQERGGLPALLDERRDAFPALDLGVGERCERAGERRGLLRDRGKRGVLRHRVGLAERGRPVGEDARIVGALDERGEKGGERVPQRRRQRGHQTRLTGRAGATAPAGRTTPYFCHSDAQVMPFAQARKSWTRYFQTQPSAGRSAPGVAS